MLPAIIGVFACCPFRDDSSDELAANTCRVAIALPRLTTGIGIKDYEVNIGPLALNAFQSVTVLELGSLR